MDKKNVIYILLDAFAYSYIQENKDKPENLPFINSLRDHTYSFENIYAQAPFTEAALRSTINCESPLDGAGYMNGRLNGLNTIFFKMKNFGYETYVLNDPMINPNPDESIDYAIYGRPYRIDNFYEYRLKYYIQLYDDGKLTDKDYEFLITMFDDNFIGWKKNLYDLLNGSLSVQLFSREIFLTDIYESYDCIVKQYKLYLEDKQMYINSFFTLRKKHPLLKIPSLYFIDETKKINDFEMWFRKKYRWFFCKIHTLNMFYNLKNNLKSMYYSFKKLKYLKLLPVKYPFKVIVKNYVCNIYNKNIKFCYSKNFMYGKSLCFPSAKKQFDAFINWIDKKSDRNIPFFSFIHLDDIHYCSMFYTYDIFEKQLRKKELKISNDYIDGIKGKYKGNITYDLAIRHIDEQIHNLYNKLNERKLLKDTIIILTSDHGYTLSNNPVREGSILNFYDEFYHVPLLLINPEFEGKKNYAYYHTKDIFDIISSVLENKNIPEGNEIIYSEFVGNGCPDTIRRPIYVSARNNTWKVSCWFKLSESEINIYEVYKIGSDKFEQSNLIMDDIDDEGYRKIKASLINRCEIIRSNFT